MATAKTAKTANKYKMLPYRSMGPIDYGSLNFDPNELEVPPDHMEQSRELREVLNLLSSYFTDFDRRPDIFLDSDTNICYNPHDLNVRVAPDVYLTFGVDSEAVHPRKIYLPWEVGKVPDWVLEVASESTARRDVNLKPNIYAQIGIPEYWRFDPTGGRYHGASLFGGRLVNGLYQPVELTTEPDGILKGYSDVLELSLAWDEGWPRFYNPATGSYLENWRQDKESLQAEREALQDKREALRAEREALQAEREAREAAEASLQAERGRVRQLEAELRRLQSENREEN